MAKVDKSRAQAKAQSVSIIGFMALKKANYVSIMVEKHSISEKSGFI